MFNKTGIIFVCVFFILSCKPNQKESSTPNENMKEQTLQISLAQWSLHRTFLGPTDENYWPWFENMLKESPDAILQGTLDPIDFATIAASYGFKSIELVNVFYYSKVDDEDYWQTFKQKCEEAGVEVGLIMCDHLGYLADADPSSRMEAVNKHISWVDIAKELGAHSIRVNVEGQGTPKEIAKNAIDGLIRLGVYSKANGINIIVENHRGISSDAKWLVGVIRSVGMDNVGTLPDFGNWCIEWNNEGCINEYDRYRGMAELLPFAKAVSAKAHSFDANGHEANTDFYKMIKLIKKAGYKGYIGIEYEGNTLPEEEGIIATKTLLEKAIKEVGA